jgi:hypothetical protein
MSHPSSTLEQTNSLLQKAPIGTWPPAVLFLTGSSGCGKTRLATELETRLDGVKSSVLYFDRIGVPPVEEMPKNWQEETTHTWVSQIAAIRDKALVIFEGQYHPKFAFDAIATVGLKDFRIAVVTAEQDVWEARLRGPRQQPNLITDDMRNWARLLRSETEARGGAVIDTSASDIEKNLQDVAALINPMLAARILG